MRNYSLIIALLVSLWICVTPRVSFSTGSHDTDAMLAELKDESFEVYHEGLDEFGHLIRNHPDTVPWEDIIDSLYMIQDNPRGSATIRAIFRIIAGKSVPKDLLRPTIADFCSQADDQYAAACTTVLSHLNQSSAIRTMCDRLQLQILDHSWRLYNQRGRTLRHFANHASFTVLDCIAPFLIQQGYDHTTIPDSFDFTKFDEGPWKPSYWPDDVTFTPNWLDAMQYLKAINEILPHDQQIPEQPGAFASWWQNRGPTAAEVQCHPPVINPSSQGLWITCYIEFQHELYKGDPLWALRDLSSVKLGDVPAITDPQYGWVSNPEEHDEDGDGVPEYMVKFSRRELIELYGDADEVTLALSGSLFTTRQFNGTVALEFLTRHNDGDDDSDGDDG